jgi:hypothetical protein
VSEEEVASERKGLGVGATTVMAAVVAVARGR